MSYTKIKNIDELKDLVEVECFIALNGGMRSSKRITYHDESATFEIYNDIDDTFQEDLSEKDLRSETNIIDALEKGALYMY